MKADILAVFPAAASACRFLAQALPSCGVEAAARMVVEDTGEALHAALKEALARQECVLVCGGGQAAAAAILETVGLPADGSHGVTSFSCEERLSAFAAEKYGQTVLFLPESTEKLAPLFEQQVLPYLTRRSGVILRSRTVGVFGLSEAAVTERLSDLLAGANPVLSLFSRRGGEIALRVTARAADSERAHDLCEPVVAEIQERLGAFVYGVDVDNLQTAVVRLLTEKQMKIATAESCTAGLLSGKLTQVSGASAVFECGVAAYSKEIKRDVLGVSAAVLEAQGAVCADTAGGMAVGARRVGGADIGVGITGEAGPHPSEDKPVGTVFLALADSRRVWIKELHAEGADRETVREIATCQALDLTRRYLEALPTVMAGGQLLDEALPPDAEIPRAAPTKKRRLLSSIFPWKGDSRPALIGKSLIWACIAAALAAVMILLNLYVVIPARNRDQYTSLEKLYTGQPAADYAAEDFPTGMLAQFYALYNQNPDVRGWIKIENTGISYPVVQNSSLDYSALNFNRESSEYGVPYFDENVALSSPASVNRSYIIHGNNTADGQMFSDLLSYTDASFLLNHPVVEMNTIYATGRFQIFAVFYVDESDPQELDYRTVSFDSGTEFLAFTAAVQERSLFTTSVSPHEDDTLLLLVTDASSLVGTADIRLVVAARLLPAGEADGEPLVLSYNPNARLPGALTATGTAADSSFSATTATRYQSSDDLPDIALPTQEVLPVDASAGSDGRTAATDVPATTGADTTTATSGTEAVPSATAPEQPAEKANGEAAFYSTLTVKIGSNMPSAVRSREELQYAVASVVKSEMGTAAPVEAQKAQAVASYTYMLYSCRDGGTFAVPTAIDLDRADDRALYDAVGEVLGVKLIDTAQTDPAAMPLCALYFSSCNGATANSQNVYDSALPYLQSVQSLYDTEEMVAKYAGGADTLTTTYTTAWADLKACLDSYVRSLTGGTVTEVSLEEGGDTPLYAVTYDTAGGYVVQTNAYYVCNGVTTYLRGVDIRKAVGGNLLRSHSFTLAYDPADDTLTFTVRGHGHALGMSQYGAMAYAGEAGWDWQQILTHYYSLSPTGRYRIAQPVWD